MSSKRSSHSAAIADAAASSTAQWIGQHGEKRMVKEIHYTLGIIESGNLPQISHLVNHNDRIDLWRFRVSNFDEDTPGGRDINSDLRDCGQPYIQMEARFPKDYPTQPFFLRIITPRMKWYTGHVTAGGSICIEALVNTGSPNGWQPSYTFESVMSLVLCNMVDCEANVVKTVSGPGGISGPLRVDLRGENHGGPHSVLREYGEGEAQAAYSRMVENHKRLGWTAADPTPPTSKPSSSNRAPHVPPPAPASLAYAPFTSFFLPSAPSSASDKDARKHSSKINHSTMMKDDDLSNPLLQPQPLSMLPPSSAATSSRKRGVGALGRSPLRSKPLESSKAPQPSSILAQQDLTADSDGDGDGGQAEGRGRRVRRRRADREQPSSPRQARNNESITILDSQDDDVVLVDFSSGGKPDLFLAPSSSSLPQAMSNPLVGPLYDKKASNLSMVIEDDDDDVVIVRSTMTMHHEKKGESLGDLQKKILELERANRLKEAELDKAKRAAEAAVEAAKKLASSSSFPPSSSTDGGMGHPGLAPPRVPPPPHWELFPPGHPEDAPLFVQLPMPFNGNDEDLDHLGPPSAPISESLVAELVGNGIAAEDARAALEHCSGDLILAYEFVFQAAGRGGASLVMKKIKEERIQEANAERMAASSRGHSTVSAAQRAQAEAEAFLERQHLSKMAAVKEEVDMIQCLFEESETLSRTYAIVAIERVQNRQLFTDYSMRKAKLEAQLSASNGTEDPNPYLHAVATGYLSSTAHQLAKRAKGKGCHDGRRSQANEKFLWHGSSLEIIKTVCSEGFDFRVSNQAGALGMGTYYSEDAFYSSQYSMRHQASSAALLQAQRAAGKILGPTPPPMPAVFQAIQAQAQSLQAQAQGMMQAFPGPGGGSLAQPLQTAPSFGPTHTKSKRGRAPRGLPPPPPPPPPSAANYAAAFAASPFPSAFDPYWQQSSAPPPPPPPAPPPAQPRQRITASPNPTFKGHSMLLCQVALGRTAMGSAGLRRPPPGHDAVHGPSGYPNRQNYAIFDNQQAYPSYLVHFAPK